MTTVHLIAACDLLLLKHLTCPCLPSLRRRTAADRSHFKVDHSDPDVSDECECCVLEEEVFGLAR